MRSDVIPFSHQPRESARCCGLAGRHDGPEGASSDGRGLGPPSPGLGARLPSSLRNGDPEEMRQRGSSAEVNRTVGGFFFMFKMLFHICCFKKRAQKSNRVKTPFPKYPAVHYK